MQPGGLLLTARRIPLLLLLACRAGVDLPAESGAGGPTDDSSPIDDLPTTDSDSADPDPGDDADAVFDLTAVHHIAVTMAPDDWLQVRDNPSTEAWYAADFTWDGEEVAGIGIRAFGQGSVVAGKPPLKLDFDHFVAGAEWRGLEQIKLDSSTQDAGFMNEAVGTRVLREMGLPAARTGWADVSVNGQHAGLFIVLESIDDQFVKRWFGDDDEPLYGMGTWMYGQGLNAITWGTVTDWYEPQTSVGGDGSEILAAITATATGTDAEFEAAVDVESFTRIAVTRATIGAIDSFAADGNNFYLCVDDGRIAPIAWDLDADLGYPYYFDNALQMGLEEPWLWSHARTNPVTGAVYSDPVHARALAAGFDVQGWLSKLLDGPLHWPTVDAQVAGYAEVLHDSACADTYNSCTSFEHRVVDLRFFLHTRLSTLAGVDVAECIAPPVWEVEAQQGSVTVNASSWGPGLMVGGEHACTGLYTPAPSRVALTVRAGTLSGAVGVHDQNMNTSTGVRFTIVQGGVALWESGPVPAYSVAAPFSVVVGAGSVDLVALGSGGASWVGLGVP